MRDSILSVPLLIIYMQATALQPELFDMENWHMSTALRSKEIDLKGIVNYES